MVAEDCAETKPRCCAVLLSHRLQREVYSTNSCNVHNLLETPAGKNGGLPLSFRQWVARDTIRTRTVFEIRSNLDTPHAPGFLSSKDGGFGTPRSEF